MYLIWKKSTMYLYFNCAFLWRNQTHYTCACAILCAGGPSPGAKPGLADDFTSKNFPITPPGNGNIGRGSGDLWESSFKVGKIRRRQNKSAAKFRTKIKTAFLGHDYFLLWKLKMPLFFKNLLLNLTIFIFCKNSFLKKFLFSWQILSPIWPRAILCALSVLCVHTVLLLNRFYCMLLMKLSFQQSDGRPTIVFFLGPAKSFYMITQVYCRSFIVWLIFRTRPHIFGLVQVIFQK